MVGYAAREQKPMHTYVSTCRSALIVLAFTGCTLASTSAEKLLTVADSLAMTRIAIPDQRYGVSNDFKLSPDAKHLIIATYHGNIDTWKNDYELTLYRVDEVLAFVNGHLSDAPPGRSLIKISAASNNHALRELRWVDDSSVLLLVDGLNDRPAQVFWIDISDGRIEPLTDHPKAVENFAVATGNRGVAYLARSELPNIDAQQVSYIVGNRDLTQITTKRATSDGYQFFFSNKLGAATISLGDPFPFHERASQRDIWLSPDARWAISQKAAADLPAAWELPPLGGFMAKLALFDEYFMGYPTLRLDQYILLDIHTGKSRPALQAPRAHSTMRLQVSGALWLESSGTVLLLDSHLPITNETSAEERGRRIKHASVLEYDPRTGESVRVVDHPIPEDGRRPSDYISAASANTDGTVTLLWKGAGGEKNRIYARRGAEWKIVKEYDHASPKMPRLKLSVKQDASTPPDIWAEDTETGVRRRLSNLNPTLSRFNFGKIEQRTWKDSKGKTWEGAVVLPPTFVVGQRYPLVIQTTAAGSDGSKFEAKEFLIDGPVYASAYAAQSYAAKGMIVLQIPNPFPSDPRLLSQLHETRLLVEGAIDALDSEGLIDRTKVALVGFSNTCVPVWYVLTQSAYDFAAAIIADGYSNSHWGYATVFGVRSPGMLYIDDIVMGGAVPWGERLGDWVTLSPSFHLDNVKGAVRLELYNDGIPADWDLYAILRRQGKPVEYAVFPNGAHNNLKPRERFLSQSGNVDWLSYWLVGYVDPDPSKVAQYARWRKMRELHEADLTKPRPSRLKWTATPIEEEAAAKK